MLKINKVHFVKLAQPLVIFPDDMFLFIIPDVWFPGCIVIADKWVVKVAAIDDTDTRINTAKMIIASVVQVDIN